MNYQESNNKIIELLAKGLTIKEIGAELNMNKRTVEHRIKEMKKEHNARTIVQLVLAWIGLKLVSYAGK